MNEFPATQIPTDSLSMLRDLVRPDSIFQMFQPIFQLSLIIDANIMIGDILWLVCKRKNPEARSTLMEVLSAKTVLAIAPTFLKEEMQVNLPKIAREKNISIDQMQAHWEEYQAHITFIDAGGPDDSFEDPKDAPYMKLQRQSGHLIFSKDSDISRMGGNVATKELVVNLRMYSRHASIEYTLKIGSAGSLHIAFSVFAALYRLARNIISGSKDIPKWILVFAIVSLICVMLHTATRESLLRIVRSLPEKSRVLGMRAFNMLNLLLIEHEKEKSNANVALQKAIEEIAVSKKENH
ncbi:MAG: hypothetical protein WA071_24080 [Undibacterium umbellatum]|uniref:hypothetical protein n=1 Tax=Undibacterium umbellatum TaxID=2762300 RepID=UPI003BB73982